MTREPAMLAQLDEIGGMPELAPYLDQPPQMPAGAPGKVGLLRLGFAMQDGRSVLADLYRVAPLLVQQALYWDEAMPHLPICMVTSIGGGTLQGDRLGISVTVGEGACAHVTTQGANRIHAMDANYASQTQTLTLGENAYLEYMPEVTIPYRHARYACRTRISLPASATLICAESVMAGRKHHEGERFAYDVLSLATSAQRPDGSALFSEKLLIEPGLHGVDLPGVMQGFDVFGNLLILTPPAVAERIQARVPAQFDGKAGIASGISRLPNEAGLMLRVVGRESYQVRARMRECWAVAREEATGATLPPEFLWR
ncbi:urease accessory protein UreD [Craterilacuibacter sp. RT1T]|uniref:urease accessory protein UreD n=1 Tax=Craterilacuibacter sp. RT1T TaxID=2942211 RepID=UPI0020C16BB8|nr:urease accessory protein UreD [Craterilacuibacter sp. RT1T]MCL6263193.1 urease accessory protein UreD [Craterilacuibacter sp. RT1T]